MQLFHYHLVTSRVREVEARYIGKLAFDLVARQVPAAEAGGAGSAERRSDDDRTQERTEAAGAR